MQITFNVTGLGEYILTRLTEKSTWAGITGLLTAAGMSIAPEIADQIAVTGIGIASMLLIAMREKVTVIKVAEVPTTEAPKAETLAQ